jgi:MoaA/NifB/PqqE/SkfB family radical SAM enzyme
MHASRHLEQTIHTERHKDFLRWAEEASNADRLWGRPATAERRRSVVSAKPSQVLETSLSRFVRDALSLALRAPSLAGTMLRFARGQRRAARIRASWETRGTHVPPLMIASITETCNLRCTGCYAMAHRHGAENELTTARWSGLFREASGLGVSFVLVAGGEPFARWEVIEAAAHTPDALFAVFTNGLLFAPRAIEAIRRSHNVVPIISLEGPQRETDSRRGLGVYRRVTQSMGRLKAAGIPFGASLTVTSVNLDVVTSPAFIRSLTGAGARIVFFVEYTPIQPDTEALALSGTQRALLRQRVDAFHAERRALFVAFPGDEERYGGCLAAGRGFIHVDPQGRLEPCPFAPFSDTSVRETSLAEALRSPLLAAIRENHGRLTETRGGCALWAERDWVNTLLAPAETAGAAGGTLEERVG